MKLKQRVDKLFHKKPDDEVVKTVVKLMKYFGWSWEDVMSIPIPSFFEIVKMVNKIEEKDK